MPDRNKKVKPSKSSYMRAARKQRMAENQFLNKYEKEEDEKLYNNDNKKNNKYHRKG